MKASSVARAALTAAGLIGLALLRQTQGSAQDPVPHFAGPLSSQPIALSSDDALLVVANPDNDTVSFFDVRNDSNRRVAVVAVEDEPNGVAITPDSKKAYVANTASGTVTVIRVNFGGSDPDYSATQTIKVGTEPYSLVMSPNGAKLYVANARSNDISVIDTATDKVERTIGGVGLEPRGLAITNDEDSNDDDETLYITNFLSLPAGAKLDGADDSKEGLVTVVSTSTHNVTATINLKPLADTGFKATGDALAKIAPGDPADAANFKFVTGAYPNQLNNIAIKGNFAFVPSTGASPNGPVRFDVNTQSLLSVINRFTNQDAGKTINMHKAVADQTNSRRLFITQPWAMAFKHGGFDGYVLSAASNIAVKITADPATGAAVVQSDPLDPTRVLQIRVGKNPRGIVIGAGDKRAYVMNYVSRSVSVIALDREAEQVIATLQSAEVPAFGSPEDKIHVGKELYNTSVGEFDSANPFSPPITGRMSRNGWGSCASCHPNGLTDNVVWIFPAGPRRTLSQHADFDLSDPQRKDMRILNWSANRDEQEDFELNIRAVSGGQGLIVLQDDVTPDPAVTDFTPLANAGRNQLKVRGVNAWDGLKAYVQFGIRSPISPVSKSDADVTAGEALFKAANCQSCHGGAQWTSSKVRFLPPPAASQVTAGQLVAELKKVGTFDPAQANEIRQNAAAPLGAEGIVPPSLLSLHAFPKTFFHNGSANSLEQALENVTHRSAGTAGVDTLTDGNDRAKLARFLLSIDSATPPIPIP
jgi:YVTN family beta-propeller protein